MNRIVRNVTANAFGGIWAIVLGLVAIPIQIRILGTEAYGLIGFITTMQVILVVFDLGLPATVVREIALNRDSEHQFSRALIQTCSTLYWIIALIVGVLFILASDWIAFHWLHVETIPAEVVAQALRLLAIYIIFLWPLNIYISTIAGLQRFDILNLLKIINTTSVQLGGIAVLLLTHNLYAFIGWLLLNAIVFLVIHIWMCFRLLPGLSLLPKISIPVIKRIWKFSFDLNLISTLSVVYTQTDRVLISALLPLRMLGYYNAAYNISRQTGTIQEFMNTAIAPALAAKAEKEKPEALSSFYFRYAQMLVYIVALPSFVLIFFGSEVLNLWVGREIANGGAVALSLLSIGFLLNSSMSTCYTLAIATGHSRIPLIVNIAGLGVYLPIMFYLLTNHALEGAALGWILLNIYYLLTLMPYTQRRILKNGMVFWMTHILLPFAITGVLIFGLGRLMLQTPVQDNRWLIVCLVCALLYTGIGFCFLDSQIRQQIINLPRQILARFSI